jgi:hypothetical protein
MRPSTPSDSTTSTTRDPKPKSSSTPPPWSCSAAWPDALRRGGGRARRLGDTVPYVAGWGETAHWTPSPSSPSSSMTSPAASEPHSTPPATPNRRPRPDSPTSLARKLAQPLCDYARSSRGNRRGVDRSANDRVSSSSGRLKLQSGSARIARATRASRDSRSGRLLTVRPRSWLGAPQLLAEVKSGSEVAVD